MGRSGFGYGLGIIGVAVFAGTLPATRVAVARFDPWFVTFGRATLAGIVALAVLLALRRPVPWRRLPVIGAIAICVVIGFPGLAGIAMATVPASHGAIVLAILPLATALAAALVAGERPSVAFWLYGLGGSALVAVFSLRQGTGNLAAGDLPLVAAVASAALGYALSGALSRSIPGWEVISWALVVSLPATLPAAVLLWRPGYAEADLDAWLAFAYLGLFSMYLGFFAWNAGLALGGVARVGQVQLLQTFLTLAIAALVNAEPIEPVTLAFAAAVVGIVWLGRRAPVRQRQSPAGPQRNQASSAA